MDAPDEPEPADLAPEEPEEEDELDDPESEPDPDDPVPDDPELPLDELELGAESLVPHELASGAFPVADPDGLDRLLLTGVAEPPGWVFDLGMLLSSLPHAQGVATMGRAQSASPIRKLTCIVGS